MKKILSLISAFLVASSFFSCEQFCPAPYPFCPTSNDTIDVTPLVQLNLQGTWIKPNTEENFTDGYIFNGNHIYRRFADDCYRQNINQEKLQQVGPAIYYGGTYEIERNKLVLSHPIEENMILFEDEHQFRLAEDSLTIYHSPSQSELYIRANFQIQTDTTFDLYNYIMGVGRPGGIPHQEVWGSTYNEGQDSIALVFSNSSNIFTNIRTVIRFSLEGGEWVRENSTDLFFKDHPQLNQNYVAMNLSNQIDQIVSNGFLNVQRMFIIDEDHFYMLGSFGGLGGNGGCTIYPSTSWHPSEAIVYERVKPQ